MRINLSIGLILILLFPILLFAQDDFPLLKGKYLGQTPPGNTPVIFAPGIVSTGHQHGSAYFTPDGKELVFSWTDFESPHTIMYMKEENGRWTKPSVLVSNTLTPCFSPDGNKVYISLNKRISVMERKGSGWSEPKDLGDIINIDKRQDFPSVSMDGNLYYSVMFGRADGMYVSRQLDGKYQTPARVGIRFRGEPVQGMPFIAPDESYLIFSSMGLDSLGMADLFICFRTADGSWSEPKNLGSKINSAAQEQFPTVTVDGKYLFFMSTRKSGIKIVGSGAGNVYWVDAGIIEELRP